MLFLNFLYSLVATLGFGVIFNIRGKKLFFAALGGGLSWFIYIFASTMSQSVLFPYFIATVCAAAYSEALARLLKSPVTTFVICAIIPLVPGGGMYNTMFESVKGNAQGSVSLGIQTLSIAGAIAIGIFIVSTITKMFSLHSIQKQKLKASKK